MTRIQNLALVVLVALVLVAALYLLATTREVGGVEQARDVQSWGQGGGFFWK